MVRTKNANVDEGGSQVPEKSKGKRPVSEFEGPEAKKKKEMARKESAKWRSSLEGHKVMCERMVDTMEGSDVEAKEVVRILKDRGLSFFFKLVKGYILNIVIEFFKNLEIVGDGSVLQSNMSGKVIVVTPDHIASYLGYTRSRTKNNTLVPIMLAFPLINMLKLFALTQASLGGKFFMGMLKDKYRIMNKIIH